jgi:hypothetical protein
MDNSSQLRLKDTGYAQFGKDTSYYLTFEDGTEIVIKTRLEHVDTPMSIDISYPDGNKETVNW